MTEYLKPLYPLGLYGSSTFAYEKISISNHDYAKYSKSSFNSHPEHPKTRSVAGSCRSCLNHSHHNIASNSNGTGSAKSPLADAVPLKPAEAGAGDGDSDGGLEDAATHRSDLGPNPIEGPLDASLDSTNPARALSKKYQKYRSLLLPKKASTTSLSKLPKSSATLAPSVTFGSLPDEIVQLIFLYVACDNAYFRTPYNSQPFTSPRSACSSSSAPSAFEGKRNYNVSFNLTPILDNKTSLLSITADHQVKMRRPKESAGQKHHEKYLNQVLRNFKLSKHYKPYPNRSLLSLLYVNKRLYRLVLPYVYKKVKLHSSYRFAQFITSIRSNNNLGLLVEDVELCDIDTLYYITLDHSNDENSYIILTEKEKNKIEHLMNNATLRFDGTFHAIDFDKVPSNRTNINELINTPERLPICIVKDEHSVVSNSDIFFDFENYDFGFKEKIVLAGWREWKHRFDPLYSTHVPTIEWVRKLHNAVRKSSSMGAISAEGSNSNSNNPPHRGNRSNSIARINSRNSSISLSSFSILSRHASSEGVGGSLRTKFRKIVYKVSSKKKLDPLRTKITKKQPGHLDNGASKSAPARGTLLSTSAATNAKNPSIQKPLLFYQHPMKSKLLHKYSTRDVPIGYIIHLLNVCLNLKSFDISRVMLAGDYEIKINAVDDYGILQERMPDTRRASFDFTRLSRPNIRARTLSCNATSAVPANSANHLGPSSCYYDANDGLHKKSKSITDFKNIGGAATSKTLESVPSLNNNSSLSIEDQGMQLSTRQNRSRMNSVGETTIDQPSSSKGGSYNSILKEIDSAYGVSIYSQFNSVLKKPEYANIFLNNNGAAPVNNSSNSSSKYGASVANSSNYCGVGSSDSFGFTLGDKNTHKKKATRPLEFYKDSFGYSNNCNYKQIQNNFYRDFWGYHKFDNKTSNQSKSKESIVVPGSESTDNEAEKPRPKPLLPGPFISPVLTKEDLRSQEPLILLNNEKQAISASENSNLEPLVTNKYGKMKIEVDLHSPHIHTRQRHDKVMTTSPQDVFSTKSFETAVGASAEKSGDHHKKVPFNYPQINIIEENKDEEENEEDTELSTTKSPSMNYFLYKHVPAQLTSENQFDYTLYLSDVRKVNHWSFDQLQKVSNGEILEALAHLKNLEHISLRSVNWINTKDIKNFCASSLSIKFDNLKSVDFRNSGMRRDLRWALEGSVKDLKNSLKENTNNQSYPLNIGRNYYRF